MKCKLCGNIYHEFNQAHDICDQCFEAIDNINNVIEDHIRATRILRYLISDGWECRTKDDLMRERNANKNQASREATIKEIEEWVSNVEFGKEITFQDILCKISDMRSNSQLNTNVNSQEGD